MVIISLKLIWLLNWQSTALEIDNDLDGEADLDVDINID